MQVPHFSSVFSKSYSSIRSKEEGPRGAWTRSREAGPEGATGQGWRRRTEEEAGMTSRMSLSEEMSGMKYRGEA